MKMSNNAKNAYEKVKCYFSKLFDVYEGRDFVEFIGENGGDPIKFRVYDNGKIYQR